MSVLTAPPTGLNTDAVMNSLEKFIQPDNIEMKTNLTPEAHAAEVELLYIQKYFLKEWKVNVGFTDLVREYDIRAVSIKDKDYHRTRQAMEVMKAQLLDMGEKKGGGLISKLLGQ